MLGTSIAERKRIDGLNPARADIIVAGTLILARVLRRLGCREIIVNQRGIRDGILLGMVSDLRGGAELPGGGNRLAWARSLARKCRSAESHCEHVASLSTRIYDDLVGYIDLPSGSRDILQAAALLHEVGRFIGYEKHHKHAYHLILHGGLQGFSANEVELIANVARYHRGSPPKKSHENFARLDRSDRQIVKTLGAILRVANGLDRAHAQRVDSVRCRKEGRKLQLLVEAASPPPAELADAARGVELLEDAIGLPVDLYVSRVQTLPGGTARRVAAATG